MISCSFASPSAAASISARAAQPAVPHRPASRLRPSPAGSAHRLVRSFSDLSPFFRFLAAATASQFSIPSSLSVFFPSLRPNPPTSASPVSVPQFQILNSQFSILNDCATILPLGLPLFLEGPILPIRLARLRPFYRFLKTTSHLPPRIRVNSCNSCLFSCSSLRSLRSLWLKTCLTPCPVLRGKNPHA